MVTSQIAVTPIPEQEAANIIGVSLRSIRNAIERGDLIRIPVTGIVQHVSKEQALLFEAKGRINRGKLSDEDLKKWRAIADGIEEQKVQLAREPVVISDEMTPEKEKFFTNVIGYMNLYEKGHLNPHEAINRIIAASCMAVGVPFKHDVKTANIE